MNDDQLLTVINRLLKKSYLESHIVAITLLDGGRNNKLYKLTMTDGKKVVLKKYFHHLNDLRDRQNSEYLFYGYAEKVARMYVPRLIISDPIANATLLEYIDGIRIPNRFLSIEDVQEAIDFINRLNASHHKVEAKQLPPASEACFSINDHLEIISSRVNRLLNSKKEYPNGNFKKTIDEIFNCWEKTRKDILEKVQVLSIDIYSRLICEDQCISPSDFGFHNAIKTNNSKIIFIDFEYAGWDDPAKLVGDFFSQIQVTVPDHYLNFFIKSISKNFINPKYFEIRTHLLMPAYKIKWCCIALNVFLPENLERRIFSNPLIRSDQYLESQIDKANLLLNNFKKKYELH